MYTQITKTSIHFKIIFINNCSIPEIIVTSISSHFIPVRAPIKIPPPLVSNSFDLSVGKYLNYLDPIQSFTLVFSHVSVRSNKSQLITIIILRK